MRYRKISTLDGTICFDSVVVKVFLITLCVCVFSSSSSLFVLFDRSSAHWLYVCFILSTASLSVQLCIVVLPLGCVHRFVLRTRLGDAHGHRREREREVHLDVEHRRINFIPTSIDDRPRCLSRQSDNRSTFFVFARQACETKSTTASKIFVRFVIGKRHSIQRGRLPTLQPE